MAEPMRTDTSVATSGVGSCRPNSPRLGKRCDAALVIAKRLAQNFLCMLAQQRRCDRVGDRRQFQTDRLFDIRDRARGGMRDLADAMAFAHLPRIESLLDGTKIADRDVGALIFATQLSRLS